MPWVLIQYSSADQEWIEELQAQLEEVERQERQERAFLANTHTLYQQGRQASHA